MSKRKFDGYLLAAKRRKEVRCLAKFRIVNGYPLDLSNLVAALCAVFASEAPRARRHGKFPWPPLDVQTIKYEPSVVLNIPADDLPAPDDVLEAINSEEAGRRTGRGDMRADTMGRLLKLTNLERKMLDIRTIQSIDPTPFDRTAARKEIDRMYHQKKREAEREARPKTSKPKKPWEALGMPRSTYFHRKKLGRLEPVDLLKSMPDRPSSGVFH